MYRLYLPSDQVEQCGNFEERPAQNELGSLSVMPNYEMGRRM